MHRISRGTSSRAAPREPGTTTSKDKEHTPRIEGFSPRSFETTAIFTKLEKMLLKFYSKETGSSRRLSSRRLDPCMSSRLRRRRQRRQRHLRPLAEENRHVRTYCVGCGKVGAGSKYGRGPTSFIEMTETYGECEMIAQIAMKLS